MHHLTTNGHDISSIHKLSQKKNAIHTDFKNMLL
jgi:hypothetical protein